MDINLTQIRCINGKVEDGFEEFITQLARRENVPSDGVFYRNGRPDAGCECYYKFPDGTIWAWQAKYFTSSLGESQWKQIDKSIANAMKKYKNITKYYIAIPIDPPDAKIAGHKSMRDKWDDKVKTWEEKYPNVDFIAWWASDIIDKLDRQENSEFYKFWFNKEIYTQEWFESKIYNAIEDLGVRYTPELNIDLDISKYFNGVFGDEKLIAQYKENANKFIQNIQDINCYSKRLNHIFNSIKELVFSLNVDNITESDTVNIDLDINKVELTCKQIDEKIKYIEKVLNKYKRIYQYKSSNRKSNIIQDEVIKTRAYYNDFKYFINSKTIQLYKNPFLVVTGSAGIGKSHLLADIVTNRLKNNTFSIMLLGQKFKTKDKPQVQILKELDLACSFSDLLEGLECTAEIYHKRVIIVIDAINEGEGKNIWCDNLNSFIAEIRKYPKLGLVISLRSTYKELFQDNIKNLIELEHKGFEDKEYTAIKDFCSYYHIDMPKVPLLNDEFSNPLFLKLFCISVAENNILFKDELCIDIQSIFDLFLKSVNNKISEDKSIKIVNRCLNAIVDYEIDNNITFISYEDAHEIVNQEFRKSFNDSKNFLEHLISEGVLIKNYNNYSNDEFVYLGYELLNDYLIAQKLIEMPINDIFKKLKQISNSISLYQGVLDMLAVLLPNKIGKEIFEVIKLTSLQVECIIAFINSLKWRKKVSEPEKIDDYIHSYILPNDLYRQEFLIATIYCSLNPINYFNATKLHSLLNEYNMPERDAFWLPLINDIYNTENNIIERIIRWALGKEGKSNISDDSIKLTLIMLGWFLASSNKQLRDNSTRAIVHLLVERPQLIIYFLEQFDNVNDPYIYERVYAAAYGAIIHTMDKEIIQSVAMYVYNNVFNKEKVYPHILLRDYAKGIIEYAKYLFNDLNKIDINKVLPPYNSDFPIIPTDEQISQLKNCADKHKQAAVIRIFRSMTPEYDRNKKSLLYGDFGRYVFQSKFYNFINPVKSREEFIMDLHNIAVKRIFSLGYSPDLHGNYDSWIDSERSRYGRQAYYNERIGKKYQWISMYELLAQVSDHYKLKGRDYYDKNLYNYLGPWEPFTRDIDPTIYGQVYKPSIILPVSYNEFDCDNIEWLKQMTDVPVSVNILQDNNKEWIVLNGMIQFKESVKLDKNKTNKEYKELMYSIKSYFVKEDEYIKIASWLNSCKDMQYDDISEPSEHYQIYNKEYVWSSAYQYFYNNEYYNGSPKTSLLNQTRGIICELYHTTSNGYLWESGYDDFFTELVQRYKKPCYDLYRYFNLKHGKDDNILYIQGSQEPACIDLNGCLYFKRRLLADFLKENSFCLIWFVKCEKMILNSNSFESDKTYNLLYSKMHKLDSKNILE